MSYRDQPIRISPLGASWMLAPRGQAACGNVRRFIACAPGSNSRGY
jgi:hypothetical protein